MENSDDSGLSDSRTRALLISLQRGESGAVEALLPIVYDELRGLAAAFLRRENPGHTLQPTALVHEVYLRLARGAGNDWSGRAHFLAVASKAMRNALVNHAVARKAAKRGGGRERLMLSAVTIQSDHLDVDSLALHEALERLAALDQRKADGVEMRFFGGMTSEEVANVQGVSLSTVEADWRMARAWLAAELEDAGEARGERVG